MSTPSSSAEPTAHRCSPWAEDPSSPPQPQSASAAGVSVVIPVLNEADNIPALIEELHAALRPYTAEYIFVDDGSSDETPDILRRKRQEDPKIRGVRHDRTCGQSAAIRTGVMCARYPIVVTLDGDGQNVPGDIPVVVERLFAKGRPMRLGMVSGRRLKRQDSWFKRTASRWANRARGVLLNDKTADTGCSLKAFPRELFLSLPYFDHMHRFLPALVQREGFVVEFVDVRHRPRLHGRSKYGVFDRLWVSISDIFGVMWLQRRCRLPSERREL